MQSYFQSGFWGHKRRGEMMAQEILDQLATAVVVLDSSLCVGYLNQAAESLFGKSSQRIVGQEVRQLFVDPTERASALRNTLETGQPYTKRRAVLESNGRGDLRAVGAMTLVASIGGAVAQLAIGRLSDRLGRRAVLAGILALAVPATAAFGFVDNVPGLLVVATVWAVAMWGVNTMAVSLCGDVAPPGSLNRVMVLDGTAYSTGAVIGAAVVFAVADTAHAAAFYAGAAAMAVGLAALPLAARPRVLAAAARR